MSSPTLLASRPRGLLPVHAVTSVMALSGVGPATRTRAGLQPGRRTDGRRAFGSAEDGDPVALLVPTSECPRASSASYGPVGMSRGRGAGGVLARLLDGSGDRIPPVGTVAVLPLVGLALLLLAGLGWSGIVLVLLACCAAVIALVRAASWSDLASSEGSAPPPPPEVPPTSGRS